MKITSITKWIVPALVVGLSLTSCSKDDENPDGQQTGQTKTIEWEVFHEFAPGEVISNFAITDDAKWLFYTDAYKVIHRINKNTGEKKVLSSNPTGASYVHYKNGKLYLLYEKDYKSYFAVSNDFGETRTEYHVGTYTNFAAGWYDGTFMNLIVNRLFVMPNGDLVLSHIMYKANNATYLQDNKLIAVSTDGGATWNRKTTDHSYISAQQGNRLFAISEAWTGVGTSELFHSDNGVTSWQASNLTYRPQAVDKENNLIAGFRNEIQKLKGNTWTVYTWQGETNDMDGLVFLNGLKYEGATGNDPNGRKMDDMEFDADNNIYVIGRNYTTICRTKLN